MKKLQFTCSNGNHKSKMLVCPQCLETITQTDIESYSTCPYCDHHFERSKELEDFILRPVIQHWMDQYLPRNKDQILINGKPL